MTENKIVYNNKFTPIYSLLSTALVKLTCDRTCELTCGLTCELTCEISLQVSSQPIPCMLTCKYRLDGLSFDSLFGKYTDFFFYPNSDQGK